MKVLILCGGKGQRMKEITTDRPKPMALVDEKPLLWHVMKIFYHYGYNDFILLLGYKGDSIKEYFMEYNWKSGSFILDNLDESQHLTLLDKKEKWRITLLETGEDTMTGGRIKQAEKFIDEDGCFLTYGDGISDIDIPRLLEFHKSMGKLATVTGIRKENQFGYMNVEQNVAISFEEKPIMDKLINGGFFVLEKGAFQYISDDTGCIFEREPLRQLAVERQLAVYEHNSYWAAADTLKDLESMDQYLKEHKLFWYENKIKI